MDIAREWILLGVKAGDRARLCPHLQAVIHQNQPMPDIWKERTAEGSWLIVCGNCRDLLLRPLGFTSAS